METIYQVVWKPRYKKPRIRTNHIIHTALYRDQDNFFFELKSSYKDFQN